jgi:hypothetical protein
MDPLSQVGYVCRHKIWPLTCLERDPFYGNNLEGWDPAFPRYEGEMVNIHGIHSALFMFLFLN